MVIHASEALHRTIKNILLTVDMSRDIDNCFNRSIPTSMMLQDCNDKESRNSEIIRHLSQRFGAGRATSMKEEVSWALMHFDILAPPPPPSPHWPSSAFSARYDDLESPGSATQGERAEEHWCPSGANTEAGAEVWLPSCLHERVQPPHHHERIGKGSNAILGLVKPPS